MAHDMSEIDTSVAKLLWVSNKLEAIADQA
jgi:hypothetical protein